MPTAGQRAIKRGDLLTVTLDDGAKVTRVAQSSPYKLSGHTWVVHVSELGCYDLARCKKMVVRPAAAANTDNRREYSRKGNNDATPQP
jgi:flagellar basal body L-ring protein FlgH